MYILNYGSCACSGWPHLQLTQLHEVQIVENFHLYKHFCICQHVASAGILSESHNQETFGGSSSLHLKFLENMYYLPMKHV
jgi:hypothetical protein